MGRDHDPGGASPVPGNRSKGAPHGAPFPMGGQDLLFGPQVLATGYSPALRRPCHIPAA
jgi:hypothetical protein